tara:strand:+ start:717 stop:962 length:246 start_codon:yes stop_codon:yes gene_type:complete
MSILEMYLIFSLLTLPLQEKQNFDNPTPFPSSKYLLINWSEDDFEQYGISKEYVLKRECSEDSKLKAEARRKWYERQAKGF